MESLLLCNQKLSGVHNLNRMRMGGRGKGEKAHLNSKLFIILSFYYDRETEREREKERERERIRYEKTISICQHKSFLAFLVTRSNFPFGFSVLLNSSCDLDDNEKWAKNEEGEEWGAILLTGIL